jgi:hypothetical protein
MTATLLLRIASVISLLFTAGHTLGGLKKWSPMGDNEVLRAMTGVRFDTMGANRSYLDFSSVLLLALVAAYAVA